MLSMEYYIRFNCIRIEPEIVDYGETIISDSSLLLRLPEAEECYWNRK